MKIHAEMAEKSQVKDQLFLLRYHFFVELRVVALNHNCKNLHINIGNQYQYLNSCCSFHNKIIYILFCQFNKTFKRN